MKKRSSPAKSVLYALLAFLVIVPYLGMFGIKMWYNHKIDKIANARFIVVDKEALSLKLFDYSGSEINTYGISCGKNPGNKSRIGDLKTPEEIFHITEIEDASTWGHDFKDGKGKIEGAYGPWFLRLEVPGHKGIGIHGTHAPESIGGRETEGCIRLNNGDLERLVTLIYPPLTVVITPSVMDERRNLKIKN